MRKWLTSHPDVIADLKRGKYGLTMGQLNADLVDLEQRKNPHSMREEGVEEGKLGTAAALAGAIALGGAMGYKHSTKDPNAEPTIKTKYQRNADVGAKLKKKIAGDQKNEGVAEGRSCNMSTEGEVCPVHGLQGCDTIMQEALAPLELAQVLHQAMEEKYPQATSQFGHEAIGDAIMDAAEDAHNTNSMSDVDMIIDDIIEQLGGQVDRDLDEGDEESESLSRSYTDPELEKTMNFAKTHYAGYPDKEQAFMKYVQRSIKHSKEEDVGQSNEIEQLRMDVAQLKRKAGLGETRMYYNVVGTSANSLRKEFGMRKDANGWYLKEDSGRRCILEAHRAFGTPLLKEYDLAAYTGSTQVQGSDNVISPIGSKRTKS
jgi:hypothetical protein